jgi:hypothetical protein
MTVAKIGTLLMQAGDKLGGTTASIFITRDSATT